METHNSSAALALIWTHSDAIIKTVALVLFLMSIATWSIFVSKALGLRKQRRYAQQIDGFWHTKDIGSGLDHLGRNTHNPFYAAALEGHEATQHLAHASTVNTPQLHDSMDLSEWVERALKKSLDDHTVRAHSGLSVLASVASTAPFIGLFGTVWGIYHALMGIGAAGQVNIGQVAGPIGEALIMTALGLLVAIPAVLGYNALLRGNKALSHQLNRFAHDLHAYFVTGARVRRAAQTNAPI
jgi:biopolymer transport protein ExbB